MNKFVKSLKFNSNKRGSAVNFDDKIALEVYTAILNTSTSTEEEKERKMQFLHNINKIIHNYDKVMEILQTNLHQNFKPVSFYNDYSIWIAK